MARASKALTDKFLSHPAGNHEIQVITRLRSQFIELAGEIELNFPEGRERALALTHLEESLMWAVKAITLPKSPTHEIPSPRHEN